MDLLLGIVDPIIKRRNEEDAVDRLNFQYTSYIYVFSALLILSKQYMGSAITCWTPAEFRGGWVEYTRDYCLIENTYWVPINDPSLPSFDGREKAELPYYQWVQFILPILAFFFMVPHYLWRSLNWQSGVQVRSIVEKCLEVMGKPSERDEAIKKVARHIHHSFESVKSLKARGRWNFIQNAAHGQTITLYYMLMKFLYIVNIVFQIVIFDIFLGFNPFAVLWRGWKGDWKTNGLFPRSTMCDFEVRTKGAVQRYSVQCVLSLNMFNEKIFALIYVWLWILLVVTAVSTFLCLVSSYSHERRKRLAVRMLQSQGIKGEAEGGSYEKKPLLEEDSRNFYNDFIGLTPDQATVIRLIAANAGDIVASHVLKELYQLERERRE